MSVTVLFVLAVLALASGLALFGVNALQRSRHDAQQTRVIDRALLRQSGGHGSAAADSGRALWRRGLDSLESIGRRFENGRIGHILLAPEDRLLLEQTNWNTATGRATFLGMRLVLALLLPVLLALWYRADSAKTIVALLSALAVGLLLPKFALNGWANRLRKRVEDELPLLIDLLRLLQGVGFSMDQSLQTIAERFQTVLPVLGRELRDANAAYIHGRPRAQSLRRLAESFGNHDLQSLVQIIVQVHEHGGAVQEPLRQFAERLREQRKMSMKEKTGKLSVKMTVVMMVTLLPALMLVLAGPAVVSLIGTMAKF
ncbi:type II secretion system F family protein [Dyella tabacisoli]|uniref:Type II secretion system F family protein n=1 Tax=Dyella tabacisoli TaxID=2282381 RepID=A0A369UML9_9GAMM|nr:type II secretion system F family protein [Dyella tabacisoli]RDD81325.1 type II secretion system F family protein [Dyella tabacisoli]